MAYFRSVGTVSFPNESNGNDQYGGVQRLRLSPKGRFLYGIRNGSHDDPFSPGHRVPYSIAAFYLLDLESNKVMHRQHFSGFTYGVKESKPTTPKTLVFNEDETLFAYAIGQRITWNKIHMEEQSARAIRPDIEKGFISALAVEPDGQAIAYGVNRQIHLWGLENETLITSLPERSGTVTTLAFSPDGANLASSDSTTTSTTTESHIRVWNLETRIPTFLCDHPGKVTALAFSITGRWLAISVHNTIYIWDVDTNTLQAQLQGPEDRTVTALSFTKNTQLLVVTYDAMIQYWYLSKKQVAKTVEMKAIFSQDGLTAVVPMEKTIDVLRFQRSANR